MIWLLACANSVAPPPEDRVPDSPARLLRRASLDLRGILPDVAQLDEVEGHPEQLQSFERLYLEDPRFSDRIVRMLAERWHTRIDVFDIHHYDYHLADEEEFAFVQAVGEEPLRLIASVIIENRPWTEVVTADYTMANELLASLWPLHYPSGQKGWQKAYYTDGRPPVGVLATNGLWWRYTTSTFNLSRSRVAAASRLLTCYDILERPISFSATPALLDPEGTATAIQTVPACVSCHATIEPAASAMFGFVPMVANNVTEMDHYHPERELLGPPTLGVEAAWYGTPIDGLAGMGEAIAADPRFASCAVQTFAEGFWRRASRPKDEARLQKLLGRFEEDGLRVKPLLLSILEDEVWKAGEASDPEERTRRMLSPEVLASAVEEFTGYRWEEGGFSQLENDERGYRILAGGVNGTNVLTPQREPGLTWAITVQRLAEASASALVNSDLDAAHPRIFRWVTSASSPQDPSFSQQLRFLAWNLFAEHPSEADIQDWTELWTTASTETGPATAWKAVVATMLRDPEFVSE